MLRSYEVTQLDHFQGHAPLHSYQLKSPWDIQLTKLRHAIWNHLIPIFGAEWSTLKHLHESVLAILSRTQISSQPPTTHNMPMPLHSPRPSDRSVSIALQLFIRYFFLTFTLSFKTSKLWVFTISFTIKSLHDFRMVMIFNNIQWLSNEKIMWYS